ncbi:Membrane transport protein [Anaerobutyricum hallii]|uniref:Membrane transport protein n=1 Tax=Anaerobutyricum hallii TaxID=39488 RepID=A0A285PSG1_9FIRM|nr:AEC family transporter [Anaerobutyricum hallii]SOB72563.1 Membrane transport protein [Anaerobutyricum hallii]
MLIQSIFQSLAMLFLLVLPGIFFRKKEWMTENQSQGVNSIIINLTWPCLVIDAMQMKFSMRILKDSGYILLVCMAVFIILFVFSYPLAKGLKMMKQRRYLMTFMLLFGNTGFIGIPVMKALYGGEAVFYVAIVELINDILIFTVGILLIQMSVEADLHMQWKKLFSPGMLGVLLGLFFFLVRITLPPIIGDAIKMLGNATTPLTMFMIGFQLGGICWTDFWKDRHIYAVAVIKLVAVPMITLFLIRLWTEEISLLEKVVIMSFAMPVGSVSAIFSKEYKSDEEFVVKEVMLSTVFCFLTIPLFALLLGK